MLSRRHRCQLQGVRGDRYQYVFVAGVTEVAYLRQALRQHYPGLQGIRPHVSIHVTLQEGYEDRAMTESGMHHYPIHVWKCPHSEKLSNPVIPRPFGIFGSAASCLRTPNGTDEVLDVTDVTQLTDEFCDSAVVALTRLHNDKSIRNHKTYKRKVTHAINILSAAKNPTVPPGQEMKTLAEFIPFMTAFSPVLPLRAGSHNLELTPLALRMQYQVAQKAALQAVHTSSFTVTGHDKLQTWQAGLQDLLTDMSKWAVEHPTAKPTICELAEHGARFAEALRECQGCLESRIPFE